MSSLHGVLSGALAMGYAVAALFFAKFWRRSGDRLFAWFSLAFSLLAFQRVMLALTTGWFENTTWLYTLRLSAFLVILLAIIDKNRKA